MTDNILFGLNIRFQIPRWLLNPKGENTPNDNHVLLQLFITVKYFFLDKKFRNFLTERLTGNFSKSIQNE